VPATIVVPDGNSREKNAAMRALGAELLVIGNDFEDARLAATRLAAERGLHLVPSFHTDLVCGVATYARELFAAVADLHTVYCPIGLGSGICGLITVRDLPGLPTRIVGVVAEGAPAYALSFAAGHSMETDRAVTVADGMACRVPSPEALAIILRGAERVVTVNDAQIEAAMRAFY
jgi:threonine dehydratase